MRNSGDRQARVRLTRQRPTPQRVRRSAASASTARSIPWVHIGAVIGAITAIGGVVFTGIATYYSARVADDQLKQSGEALQQAREDAEQKVRSQAEQVSVYMSGGPSAQDVHIINRSADPIRSPRAIFWIHDPMERVYYETRWFGDLPPCRELIFKAAELDPPAMSVLRTIDSGKTQIVSLRFTDRNGLKWYRTPDALKQLAKDAPLPRKPGPMGFAAPPTLNKVESCGD